MGNKTLKVEVFKTLEDGIHKGKIVGIEWRDNPYEYMDVVIEVNDIRIKAGYPAKVTPYNKTGALFYRFGINLEEGLEVDPEKILVGKSCQFVSISKQTAKGTFANVQTESLKPL